MHRHSHGDHEHTHEHGDHQHAHTRPRRLPRARPRGPGHRAVAGAARPPRLPPARRPARRIRCRGRRARRRRPGRGGRAARAPGARRAGASSNGSPATTTSTPSTATTRSTASSTRSSTGRRTASTGWSSPTTAASPTPRSAWRRSTPTSSRPATQFDDETLVFQGLEWNIPAAEHGTVFVHPGSNEVAVLKEFENAFDGVVQRHRRPAPRPTRRSPSTGSTSWPRAVKRAGSRTRCSSPTTRPARASTRPHEIRGWRDRQPADRARHGGRARPPGRRDQGSRSARAPAAASTTTARQRTRSRLPAGELPHLGRLRLDDRHRRRPLGQPARRGQAVVDHRQLRLAHRLPRRLGPWPRQQRGDFDANGRYGDPVHGGDRTQPRPTATSGPATTAAPTSAPRPSRTPR